MSQRPSLGRVVLFYEGPAEPSAPHVVSMAHVTFVYEPATAVMLVDLAVLARAGLTFRSCVPHRSACDDNDRLFWDWPPRVAAPSDQPAPADSSAGR